MQIGFIGLGRMGGSMTRRLAEAGHTVVAWDRSVDAVRRAATGGVAGSSSVNDRKSRMPEKRSAAARIVARSSSSRTHHTRCLANAVRRREI